MQKKFTPDAELNVCRHLMHDEHGQYVGTLQFVPADVGEKLFATLKDIELLVRVNAPIVDGSPMHKAICETIRLAT